MQIGTRSLIPIGLLSLLVSFTPGCGKKSGGPEPQPEAPSATVAANKQRPNLRGPLGPGPKIDPQATKDYRLDLCYYGTFTLRQARESYLASLGKDEPSEKKIPNFGIPATPTAASATPPAPLTTGSPGGAPVAPSAKPGPSAAAPPGSAAKPAASAAPATPPPDRRPFDFALRAPHERNARTCSSIAQVKEPAMGDVDTAAAAYAPLAAELAKDIVTANNYYQREEYKKDKFAQGKELHKKLLDEFQKLDDLQDKLGNAIAAYRKDHPPDPAKQDPGEKEVAARFEQARGILLTAVTTKKVDAAAFKDAVSKLDASIVSLREWSAGHSDDVWSKLMIGALEAFAKSAKELKIDGKAYDAEGMLTLINNFTSLIEVRQRALGRAMIAKGQTANQPGLPPGHPPMSAQ